MSTKSSEESFPEKVVIDGYVINDICWLLKAVEEFALYGELGAFTQGHLRIANRSNAAFAVT